MNQAARLTLWLLVVLLSAAARAKDGAAPLPVPVKHYLDARKLLYDDDLPSAVELFERVVREHGDSEVADDSLYWAAWCRSRMQDGRPRAIEAWLRLMKRYPESPWMDETAIALRSTAREKAVAILEGRFANSKTELARNRIVDALAILGDEEVFPALWLRMTTYDGDAANALSHAGKAGAAALEDFLTDAGRSPGTRALALRHWSRAVLTEKTVPHERALEVVAKIAKDPMLVESTREIRALAAALADSKEEDEENQDLRETVRRLRREVAELTKQIAELEKLIRK
jgi:Tetratricopeptide repeat